MKLYFLSFLFVLVGSSYTFAINDFMNQAFQPSRDLQQVVNVGNTKQQVGNSIFYQSAGLTCGVNERFSCRAVRNQGLLVYGIRLLLRLVIILSIPFMIFNGVYLITSAISGTVSNVLKYVYNIFIGVAAVLSSIALIQLVQSAVVATILAQLFNLF